MENEKFRSSADLVLKIGRDTYALIKFEGEVRKEDIERLIAVLEVQKEAYDSDD